MGWKEEVELRKQSQRKAVEERYAATRYAARQEKEYKDKLAGKGWGYQIQSVDGVRNPNFQPWVAPTEETRKYAAPLQDNSGTIIRDLTFQGVEAPEGGILNNMAKVKEERLSTLLGQDLVGLLSPKTQGNVYSDQGIPSFDSGFSRPYQGQDYVPMSTERQGIPSYLNPTVDSNVNPLQQPYHPVENKYFGRDPFTTPYQPVTDRPWYGDSTNPSNLLNVEEWRLMDMVDSGILLSGDYINLRENAERWKAQDAEALNLKAERTTNDFGQILPQADFYGNQLTPSARVDLYQDQTDRTNALLNQKEFSYMDDISEPDIVGGILDQHANRNEADNPSSIWSELGNAGYNAVQEIREHGRNQSRQAGPLAGTTWEDIGGYVSDFMDTGADIVHGARDRIGEALHSFEMPSFPWGGDKDIPLDPLILSQEEFVNKRRERFVNIYNRPFTDQDREDAEKRYQIYLASGQYDMITRR
jgi:hypothetical protein